MSMKLLNKHAKLAIEGMRRRGQEPMCLRLNPQDLETLAKAGQLSADWRTWNGWRIEPHEQVRRFDVVAWHPDRPEMPITI